MYLHGKVSKVGFFQRLGRRGSLLFLIGLSWVGTGTTNLLFPSDRFSSDGDGTDEILQIFDHPYMGFLWIFAGLFATVGALTYRSRRFSRMEVLGWNAILTPALTWLCLSLWSFMTFLVTEGSEGRGQSAYASIIWVLVSAIIMIIAGWPENDVNNGSEE